MIQQQQRAHPPSAGSAKPIGGTIAKLRAKLDAIPQKTPEELADESYRQERLRQIQRESERRAAWGRIVGMVGKRYADCTLDNFATNVDPVAQSAAVRVVREYAENVADNIASGRGVLFYGPPGTGKDHLATALMRYAVEAGYHVEWADGADLYSEIRDRIADEENESEFVRRYTKPALLVISDPLPPLGEVKSAFQLSMLFRVLDRRYREQLPTVVTVNVADRAELERRLSPNIVDRLAHGTLAVHCNWPSFRR